MWLLLGQPHSEAVQTAYGERQTLTLSDGSLVELNANSALSFERDWSDDEDRQVWLEGEAFFAIEKKPVTAQKMKVETNDLTVEVLGTSFNVNTRGERTIVYLEEGSIRLALHAVDSVILMEPGDLVQYSRSSGQIIRKHREQAKLHTSWRDGVLTFEEAYLGDVLRKIEAVYGVKFIVKDPDAYRRQISFPLPIEELETAIFILDKTLTDLEFKKEGNVYFIE